MLITQLIYMYSSKWINYRTFQDSFEDFLGPEILSCNSRTFHDKNISRINLRKCHKVSKESAVYSEKKTCVTYVKSDVTEVKK